MTNFYRKSAGYGFMKSRIAEIIFVLFMPSCACCLELPDKIDGWQCVNEYVVPLVADANSADMGTITYRDYERDNRTLNVILTQGKGTGSFYVPEHVNDAKGVMPSGSGYEVLEVAGFKAVLERHEYLPLALSVNVSKDTVLTIESSPLNDEEDITHLAGSILSRTR